MNKLELIIENAAERDMSLVAEYISKDKKCAAVKMLNNFYKSFEKLSLFPDLGCERSDFKYKNVKFFIVKKHYLIVYIVKNDSLHILRVLSSYQDICNLL